MGLSSLTDDELCFVYTVVDSANNLKYDKNEERLKQLKHLDVLSEKLGNWLVGIDITNVNMASMMMLLDIKSEMGNRFFKNYLAN